jgi:stage II sporulation protein GA (sporulation sigma-E factor processing peptidase)
LYLEIYPDIIFLLNFIMDFILLYLLKKINKKNSSLPRLLGAAAIGALFTVIISIFPWMNLVMRFLLMYIVVSVLMILIAFGKLSVWDLVKQTIALYLITYFIGGLINSIYYHIKSRGYLIDIENGQVLPNPSMKFIVITILLIIPFILLMIWMYRWYKNHSLETYDVDLILFDRCVHTKGLMDSGNCLYDPIYQKPVIVIENTIMKELLTPEFIRDIEEAKSYLQGNNFDVDQWNIQREHIPRLRFIPYQSIGKKGVLLGINLDKVLIYTGKETICNEKVTAAISDHLLSVKRRYHVILHKGLI